MSVFHGRLVVVGIGPEEISPVDFRVHDPSCFAVQCFLRIGASTTMATQDQHLVICSPSWLVSRQPHGAILRGQGLLLMNEYDGRALRDALTRFVERCTGITVTEVFAKVARLGFSEFEDYDAVGIPQYFIDQSHENEALSTGGYGEPRT